MKLNKKLIEDQIKCAKALTSHTVIQSCLTTIERECKKFGVDYPIDWSENEAEVDIGITNLGRLHVFVGNKKVDYDIIMANKHTFIGDTEKINCSYGITQVLVGYDTNLRITFDFSCKLPEEDLITLRNLGKVKVEHNNYSSMRESIICEV